MRMIMKVSVAVPESDDVNDNKLHDFGIFSNTKGFFGLPEDLDNFFAFARFDPDEPFGRAFYTAKVKWNEGNISYV
jgi:hypothetical protein